MRDARRGRKFGRETDQRRALLSGLASSLIIHGKMKTTEARAKEVRKFLEPIITTAKKQTLTARRRVGSQLNARAAARVMTVAKGYEHRSGGYLRITKLGNRGGDAARVALIEFV
ncbi:MAG: 50S ribosomal protein L17 [Patescibacteria group bacterium]